MFKEKIKALISKGSGEENNGNNKKKIENLVVLILILIITVIVINLIWNGDNENKESEPASDPNKKLATSMEESYNNEIMQTSVSPYEIDKELEQILSKIQGVGEVNVMITYSQTSQTVPFKKDIIFKENDGKKEPITQSIISPKIEGAIIAAKGATNAEVKSKIVQAVEAVTGLATHKIQVFEMQE